MTAPEEGGLLKGIERSSLILSAILLLASLPLRSPAVSAGLLLGGALAFLNFRWLRNFAVSVTRSGRRPRKRALFFYSLKYLFTGVAIFVAIKYDFADAVALLAGVSVIFLAICWEGARHNRNVKEGVDHAIDI